MTELIIYNILFWVPYIYVCRLPEILMEHVLENQDVWELS
jgi:hypothetical protein